MTQKVTGPFRAPVAWLNVTADGTRADSLVTLGCNQPAPCSSFNRRPLMARRWSVLRGCCLVLLTGCQATPAVTADVGGPGDGPTPDARVHLESGADRRPDASAACPSALETELLEANDSVCKLWVAPDGLHAAALINCTDGGGDLKPVGQTKPILRGSAGQPGDAAGAAGATLAGGRAVGRAVSGVPSRLRVSRQGERGRCWPSSRRPVG